MVQASSLYLFYCFWSRFSELVVACNICIPMDFAAYGSFSIVEVLADKLISRYKHLIS
jgi:uncharacterized SAM-binding protein YcdF (DUF218 family)